MSGRALDLHGAGTPCIDDSRFGVRIRDAGPGHVVLGVWLAERKAMQEHLVIHEITDQFDPAGIHKAMSPTHAVYSFLVCPTMLGHPVRRLRMITFAVRKDLALTAPLSDFFVMMGRKCVMKPGDYYVLTDDPAQPDLDKYIVADKQGLLDTGTQRSLVSGCRTDKQWVHYLLPSQRERLEHFLEQQLPALIKEGTLQPHEGVIIDLNQDPRARALAGAQIVWDARCLHS